tara:strand:- start:68 stop:706 length:639 start_codon:yes stop_codon:yes gene_type:complete
MDIEYLLLQIAEKETDLNQALKALGTINEKFKDFIYNVVFKNISFIPQREELACNILTGVLKIVWEKPLEWTYDSSLHETQIDGFKAYMATIIKLKLYEEIRAIKDTLDNEVQLLDEEGTDWVWPLIEEEYEILEKKLPEKDNPIEKCLLSFSKRDRDILRMYFLFYEEGKRMPSDVVKMMESQFGTTWLNIRQIISRSKKKIKNLIEENKL